MLDDFGVLRISGPDALRFLQGQLSNDVEQLPARHSLLAGLHTPQGRTIAVLRLFALDGDDLLAVLPRELAEHVLAWLRRHVLRSKVTLAEESAAWRVAGVGVPSGETPQITQGVAAPVDATRTRWLCVTPCAAEAAPAAPLSELSREQWRLADIAAGLPQVYAATSGSFVAQMLNLDCVEAISFQKGCYTGQEVIARAHYRGRVKRRMQRFRARTHAPLAPGFAGRFADGRGFIVVEAARTSDDEAELLAIAPLDATEAGEEIQTAQRAPAGGVATISAEQLPLPYELPA